MDFTIDNVRSFLTAMIYIRMFGMLHRNYTGDTGIVLRTYTLGKYIMDINNLGSGLGMDITIYDTKYSIRYNYYAVTDKRLIKIFELPNDKFTVKKY